MTSPSKREVSMRRSARSASCMCPIRSWPLHRCGAPCGRAAALWRPSGASAGIAAGPRFSPSSTRASPPRSVRCSSPAARPAALRQDFEAAGLVDIRERRQQETLEFRDATALLTAMLRGGPVALAVKRFTAPVMAEVEGEFLASVRAAPHRRRSLSHPRRVRHRRRTALDRRPHLTKRLRRRVCAAKPTLTPKYSPSIH